MQAQITCPICGEFHPYLVTRYDPNVDQPLINVLAAEVPGWQPGDGACTRCLDQAHIELQSQLLKGNGAPGEVNGYKILPVPVRLSTDVKYSGKDVTICIIDSGFYPHADLVSQGNRILTMRDITQTRRNQHQFSQPDHNAWHGTMTSVVSAGDGSLSGGLYRGIAHQANLVLLKVTDAQGAITSDNIVKAINWAIKHASHYRIRIINLSVTDDEEISYLNSPVDQAVRRAVEKGIVVVAAAGNDPHAPLKSPANAPHAISVGGLNDRNTLDPLTNTLYQSTYGVTMDGLQKPDLIAPAIWVPAPILPGTKEQREAAALFALYASGNGALKAKLANLISHTALPISLLEADVELVRSAVTERIAKARFVSPHYQHADGTSFAAPITTAVIAQMLEANPNLDPWTIREILLTTAKQLPGEVADRQGWGLIQPVQAVRLAEGKQMTNSNGITPVVDYRRMMVDFYLHYSGAKSVVLTGDFTQWSHTGHRLSTNGNADEWHISLPFKGSGIYRYKYLINGNTWISDPRNLFREPDGYNDFNSKLIIQ